MEDVLVSQGLDVELKSQSSRMTKEDEEDMQVWANDTSMGVDIHYWPGKVVVF